MALIKCASCGKQISDSSKKCVNCGAKLQKDNETKILKLLSFCVNWFFKVAICISIFMIIIVNILSKIDIETNIVLLILITIFLVACVFIHIFMKWQVAVLNLLISLNKKDVEK